MARTKKRTRRVPQRTCVACREVQGKRSLVRIVRSVDGGVQLDLTGKLAGRGAYLCAKRTCFERALEQDKLDYALKTKLSDYECEALAAFSRTLPEEMENQGK